ncbi:MAG TPA: isoprenoid biosynthesis glyoxalase ElbB [Candidatus Kapabacteria bacterium]|nr:isoprenoid biosynthesis glyoxalase ElbB [Candidatus Kapabacteria bacterium]
MKKVAVILSGSGYLDGSEIREAVGVLWVLSVQNATVQCFAPDINQSDVINHFTGQPVGERRNVLAESARIARGKVKQLSELHAEDFDALVMPGGFGAAKNLSTFAFEGSNGTVLPDLSRAIRSIIDSGKPLGAACIAPAVVALAMKGTPLELSVGAVCDASKEIEKLGHKHIVTRPDEIHIDRAHNIVTTPAYMYDAAPLHEIFEGIRKMVEEVMMMSKKAVAVRT